MPLEIIGSGLGRTGTKSLQTALNMLGFGPCYHMIEVFQDKERKVPQWIKASKAADNGDDVDWDAVFDGYRSSVDYPGAAYWRELVARYPQAKVIHTVRDPEAWFESTQATIFRPGGVAMAAFAEGGQMADFFKSFIRGDLIDHLHNHDFLVDYFRRHTEEVKAAVSPERLLVYQAGQGWGPLSQFLGVPIPAEPYPSENSRAEFIARRAAMEQKQA
jgi:hypothetical protein